MNKVVQATGRRQGLNQSLQASVGALAVEVLSHGCITTPPQTPHVHPTVEASSRHPGQQHATAFKRPAPSAHPAVGVNCDDRGWHLTSAQLQRSGLTAKAVLGLRQRGAETQMYDVSKYEYLWHKIR